MRALGIINDVVNSNITSCLFVYLRGCLSFCVSVCLSVRVSTCLSACLSVCLSVSVWLSASACLSQVDEFTAMSSQMLIIEVGGMMMVQWAIVQFTIWPSRPGLPHTYAIYTRTLLGPNTGIGEFSNFNFQHAINPAFRKRQVFWFRRCAKSLGTASNEPDAHRKKNFTQNDRLPVHSHTD